MDQMNTAACHNIRTTSKKTSAPDNEPVSGWKMRFWGLDAVELYDRCWSSYGVEVVRRGQEKKTASGPQFYLLLEQNDLVLFNLRVLIKQFNWLKPSAIRLRITDSHGEGYHEYIEVGDNNQLISVQRGYENKMFRTIRAWLTPRREVAEAWRLADNRRDGWKKVGRLSDPDRVLAVGRPGRIFDYRSESDCDACLAVIQDHWQDIGSVVDGVYEYQPGVWLHESVVLPKQVRFVGPLWLGAGAKPEQGNVLIGPGGRPDESKCVIKQREIPWGEFNIADWRRNNQRRRRRFSRVSKRLFDIAFALTAIIGTLPLYPFIMTLILIQDGWPPFFAHRRQTLRGKEFPCFKFRTMQKSAEEQKQNFNEENVCDGPQFYIKDDPRLLKCGAFLRKYQFDELPQFWNVLLGHMSVVGPRPSPEKENQYCPTWREARLSVRPGVTGLWQVRRTRKPQTDFQEWIRYDLEYVQHQSWRLDLWIIWQTIKRIFKG